MKSRSRAMLDKSIAAVVSAIEIYNKPDFKYREETFSVLNVNAWELLFKAKILQLSGNKLKSLYVLENRQNKDGSKSKKKYARLSRSGNPMSLGMFDSLRVIQEEYGVKIEKPINDNLTALTEIRDNAIHFMNEDLLLATKVQEIGSASLQNYINLVKEWFGDVLMSYNFYLMPISFFRDFSSVKGVTLNAQEKNLIEYLKRLERNYDDDTEIKDFNLSLRIDIAFKKVKSTTGVPFQISQDPDAPVIRLEDEDFKDKYPWDYNILTTRLKKRYSDFKVNKDYHAIKDKFYKDSRYCKIRYLNPGNPRSGSKAFFSPNIVKEFDKHYTKNSS